MERNHLCKELCEEVDQANRPEIEEVFGIWFFGTRVKKALLSSKIPSIEIIKLVEGLTNIDFYHVPATPKVLSREAVRDGDLTSGVGFDGQS